MSAFYNFKYFKVFFGHNLFSTGIKEAKPFVIGIWCGNGKPKDLNEFLERLVDDLNEVIANGIGINGFQLNIKRVCFVADSPARSFLLGYNLKLASLKS